MMAGRASSGARAGPAHGGHDGRVALALDGLADGRAPAGDPCGRCASMERPAGVERHAIVWPGVEAVDLDDQTVGEVLFRTLPGKGHRHDAGDQGLEVLAQDVREVRLQGLAPELELRHVDPEEWRTHIGVLFQDFVRYQLSASDNVELGAGPRAPDADGDAADRAVAVGSVAHVACQRNEWEIAERIVTYS